MRNIWKRINFRGNVGSYDSASGKQAIHLLNPCDVESGIVLGQLDVGAKTDKISAVPEIILIEAPWLTWSPS